MVALIAAEAGRRPEHPSRQRISMRRGDRNEPDNGVAATGDAPPARRRRCMRTAAAATARSTWPRPASARNGAPGRRRFTRPAFLVAAAAAVVAVALSAVLLLRTPARAQVRRGIGRDRSGAGRQPATPR